VRDRLADPHVADLDTSTQFTALLAAIFEQNGQGASRKQ
jgi:hypothetical protein